MIQAWLAKGLIDSSTNTQWIDEIDSNIRLQSGCKGETPISGTLKGTSVSVLSPIDAETPSIVVATDTILQARVFRSKDSVAVLACMLSVSLISEVRDEFREKNRSSSGLMFGCILHMSCWLIHRYHCEQQHVLKPCEGLNLAIAAVFLCCKVANGTEYCRPFNALILSLSFLPVVVVL
jgi:hypothetical protein